MQLELSQLLQMMFNVKFHSNALEKVQSNQISKLFEIANSSGQSSKLLIFEIRK